jgi:hypothetical protein
MPAGELRDMPAIAGLSLSLRELEPEKCPWLDAIDDIEELVNLRFFGFSDCGDLESLAELVQLEVVSHVGPRPPVRSAPSSGAPVSDRPGAQRPSSITTNDAHCVGQTHPPAFSCPLEAGCSPIAAWQVAGAPRSKRMPTNPPSSPLTQTYVCEAVPLGVSDGVELHGGDQQLATALSTNGVPCRLPDVCPLL